MLLDNRNTYLYIFFGLIASGKSTLAERFATLHGFLYLNTDRVRKDLAGIDAATRKTEGYDQGIYSGEFTRKTYQAMLDSAEQKILAGGQAVVLDGSYSSREERSRVVDFATRLNAGYVFIHCVCSDKTVRERLEQRAKDPLAVSDGRWEIFLLQREQFQPPSELDENLLVTVETEQSVDVLLENLASTLKVQ